MSSTSVPSRCRTVATVAAFAFVVPLTAQAQLQREFKEHVPDRALSSPVIGDFDGDGDLDVLGSAGAFIENAGGQWVDRAVTALSPLQALEAHDFDGDGVDDILFAPLFSSSPLAGAGVAMTQVPLGFTIRRFTGLPGGSIRSQCVADWDGDGDLDIAIGSWAGQGRMVMLANDGLGNFTDVTAARMPAAVPVDGVLAVDADGDGDLDMVVRQAWVPQELSILVNQGGGVFAPPSMAAFPAPWGWRSLVGAADIDGDGDVDLVTGDGVLVNTAGGVFTLAPAPLVPTLANSRTLRTGDLDGDGDQDLWVEYIKDRPRWFENVGGGYVDRGSSIDVVRRNASSVELADLDGDGLLDVLAVDLRAEVLRGQPGGRFVDLTPDSNPESLWGDFNGDGWTDGLRVTASQGIELGVSDGAGGVTYRTVLTGWSVAGLRCAADLDGDGDLDVVATGSWTGRGGEATILTNDGAGNLQPALRPVAPYGQDVFAEDLNGDGDTDLVIRFPGTVANTLFLRNAGVGQFVVELAWQVPALQLMSAGEWFDADGDGDIDLIAALDDPVLFTNDGTGRLTAVPNALPRRFATAGARVRGFSSADFDGDGDRDLLVIYDPTMGGGDDVAVYENLGSGSFGLRNVITEQRDWWTARWVDLDGDGAVEIVGSVQGQVAGSFGETAFIYEDDGLGGWAPSRRTIEGVSALSTGQFLDRDDDGDIDFAGAILDSLVNTQQQIRSRFVPRLGGSLELEVANPSLTQGVFSWILVSTGRLAMPLPLGRVGRLVPDPAAGGVAVAFNAVGGQPAQLSVPVPNSPAFLGAAVYCQGLILSTTNPRLTNTITEVIAN